MPTRDGYGACGILCRWGYRAGRDIMPRGIMPCGIPRSGCRAPFAHRCARAHTLMQMRMRTRSHARTHANTRGCMGPRPVRAGGHWRRRLGADERRRLRAFRRAAPRAAARRRRRFARAARALLVLVIVARRCRAGRAVRCRRRCTPDEAGAAALLHEPLGPEGRGSLWCVVPSLLRRAGGGLVAHT